jgi:hypothetical protein
VVRDSRRPGADGYAGITGYRLARAGRRGLVDDHGYLGMSNGSLDRSAEVQGQPLMRVRSLQVARNYFALTILL